MDDFFGGGFRSDVLPKSLAMDKLKPNKKQETIVNDTDDGRNPANQRLVGLSHYLRGLYTFQVVVSSINSMGDDMKLELKHF